MPIARAVASTICAFLALAAGACAPLSVDEERRLGADFSRNIERRANLVRDPEVTGYVSAIGRRLLAHAGPQPFPYRFHVVARKEINAFAAPAGHIYLHTGTLLKARNVSELAGVIAHEIGHVAKRHIAHNFNRALATNIAHHVGVVAAELAAGPEAARAAHAVGGVAALGYLNTFSREAEREADAFAVRLMFKAGYDPRGLATFFETLRKEGKRSAPAFLSSHPTPASRIATTREMIGRLPPGAPLEVGDGGKLRRIQDILRQIATGGGGERPSAAFPGHGRVGSRPGSSTVTGGQP